MTFPHRIGCPSLLRVLFRAALPLTVALTLIVGIASMMADDGGADSATSGAEPTDEGATESTTAEDTPGDDDAPATKDRAEADGETGTSETADSNEPAAGDAPADDSADDSTKSPAPESAGQSLLDEATRARLTAANFRDLNSVVDLLEEAIEKGLDDSNREIADQMLAGTLLERGRTVTRTIIDQKGRNRRWPDMRRLAVADLRRVLKLDKQSAEAHLLLAQLLLMPGGDRLTAADSLDRVVAAEEAPARMRSKALLLRAELETDDEKRLADYQQAIELMPDETEAVRARAGYQLNKGRADEALIDLNRVLEVDAKDANMHVARGMALFMKRDYDEALASFDRATELAPEAARPYEHRARIYALKNNAESVLAQLDKGLELEPRSTAMLLLRAQIRQMMEDSDGALSDVDQAIKIVPNNLTAKQMRALILAGAGKRDEAIEDLRRLSSTNPDNTEVMNQLAELYMADGQRTRAIKLFDAILATDSKNWRALRNRGDVLLNIGKQREAIADYDAAIEIEAKHSGLLNNLAWVLSTSPDESLRDGRRAVELATKACEVTEYKMAHILSTLAAAYAETGDFESAIKWSKKAVEIGDELHDAQLSEELKSYEAGRPWREVQSADDEQAETDEETDPLPEPGSAQSSEPQPSEF